MSILSAQLLTALVLLLGTLFCGILPGIVIWRRSRWSGNQNYGASPKSNKILSFLMCFGGGVLFATCFVHMLPEVQEHFEDEIARSHSHRNTSIDNGEDESNEEEEKTISMPMVFVSLGFFCVFCIEEGLHAILHTCHKQKGNKNSSEAAIRSFTHAHVGHLSNGTTSVNSRHTTELTDAGQPSGASPMTNINNSNHPNYYSTHDHLVESDEYHSSTLAATIRGILIVAALSFHSLFEGMAVGLQKTEKDIWTTGMAIAVHKFVVAFAVGLDIYSDARRILTVCLYMLVFALMSPIGIIIAILAGSHGQPDSSDHTINILSAMATGTLLYIVFMEILQRDQHKNLPGILQLIAVALGWAIMAGIQAETAKYDAD